MDVRFGTAVGRGVIAATVLGSGIAFLDGTVVNVALPAIADDFNSDIASLQWTVDTYLVTLTALLLLGGSIGDRYGHKRVYLAGLVWFTIASVACAAAPNVDVLIVSRAVQGIGAAFLVPGSLAIIGAVFVQEDRSRAIGLLDAGRGVVGRPVARCRYRPRVHGPRRRDGRPVCRRLLLERRQSGTSGLQGGHRLS